LIKKLELNHFLEEKNYDHQKDFEVEVDGIEEV